MKIYHYDKATGELTGETTARQSPLEPGVFLIPAAATTIAPPQQVSGEALVFINGSWQSLPDNRGDWYDADGTLVTISDIGASAEGLTKEPPAPTAEQIKQAAITAIAAQRYAIETGGVMFGEYQILTDRESQQILDSALEKVRRGLVESIVWKCGNGKWLTIDETNAAQIEGLVLAHVQGAFAWEKSELEKLEE